MTPPKPPKRTRRRGGLLRKLSKSFSDPREVGGSIDAETRLIAPKDAMLLRAVAVAEMGMERDGKGEVVIAIELRGNINTTGEEVNPLILCSPDGLALWMAQATALVRGSRVAAEFDHCLAARMEEAMGSSE
jgi:hypothetical protein